MNQYDFTLRIQHSDLTKAVSQWLNDGLGITKDNIGEYLQEAIDRNINKYLESIITKASIEKTVSGLILDYFRQTNWNYNGVDVKSIGDLTRAMISSEVKASVKETIRKITDEYLTITYSPKTPDYLGGKE